MFLFNFREKNLPINFHTRCIEFNLLKLHSHLKRTIPNIIRIKIYLKNENKFLKHTEE